MGTGRVLLLYVNAYAVPFVWLAFCAALVANAVVAGRQLFQRLGRPQGLAWPVALAVAGALAAITNELLPSATAVMNDNTGQIVLAAMAGCLALTTLILVLRLVGAARHRTRGVRFVPDAAPPRAGGSVAGHFAYPPGLAPAAPLSATLRCVEGYMRQGGVTEIWSETKPVLGANPVAFNPPASCPASRPWQQSYVLWQLRLTGALLRGRIDAIFEIPVAGAEGRATAPELAVPPQPSGTWIASRALPRGAMEFHVPASHSPTLALLWGGCAVIAVLPMVLLPLSLQALVILGIGGAVMAAAFLAAVFGETWLIADARALEVRPGLCGVGLWRWNVPAAEIAELGIGQGGSRGTVALRLKRRDGRVHHLCGAMGDAAGAQWLAAELRRQLRLP